MAYLTPAQLRTRFDDAEIDELVGQLSSTAADEKIAAAIGDAEAVVNSYLSVRYKTPLSPSSLLAKITGDLARYNLHDNQAPKKIKEDRDDQIAFLVKVSTYKANFAGATDETVETAAGSSGGFAVSASASRLGLENY